MSTLRQIELSDRLRTLALEHPHYFFDWLDAGPNLAAGGENVPEHPTSQLVCQSQTMTPGANLVLNGTGVVLHGVEALIPTPQEVLMLTGNVADVFSAEIHGINHLGEEVREIVTKVGTGTRIARILNIFTYVFSIRIRTASGPTGLVRVGTPYSNNITTLRLQVPWAIRDAAEIGAVVWRKRATGYATTQPAFASLPASGFFALPANAAMNFQTKTFLALFGAYTQGTGAAPAAPALESRWTFGVIPHPLKARIFAGLPR